ncbi:MAG: thiopurine S-methyltransferase [Thiotrichales bacterium]|nr:MAG: thiopurine S-methyltransferase [Thiotrichales bacterium]
MDIDFWLERWDRGETGFHQQHINPYLGYYYGELGPPPEKRAGFRVFVPLCGKSRDLWWLQQSGYDVVGVEFSELAVEQFVAGEPLDFKKTDRNGHDSYKTDRLEILVADFFDLQEQDIGNITDIYDRASLIALPVDMRRRYVEKITALQPPGTRTLLITLTYPDREMEGPPFSVTEEEVKDLYSGDYRIEKLAAKNVLEDEPRFKQRGLTSLTETAYKLTRIR